MKKLLLPFLLVFGFTLVTGVLFGQPTVTYPMTSTPTIGTTYTTAAPADAPTTATGVATGYTYGAAVALTGATLSGPLNLGIDPTTGDVYVANSTNGSISVWDKNGVFIQTIASVSTKPVGIVFDAAGNAYVIDGTTNSVYKFTGNNPGNLDGTVATIITGLTSADGIAIDASGNLYISDLTVNTYGDAYKYTGSGTTYTKSITYSNLPLYRVTDVGVDPSGAVYAVSTTSPYNKVIKYTAQATYTTFLSPTTASSIFIDNSGNVYLANTATNNVTVYNSAGTLLATLSVTNPQGVVADNKGDIFVSSTSANTVYEFKPTSGYALNNPPPPGLTFDNTTGKFIGKPTTAFTSSYVVTAYGATGTGTSNTFTITVGTVTKPSLSYSTYSYSYMVGAASSTINIINGGGAVTSGYAFSGTLISGVTFNTSTGSFTSTNTTAGTVTGTVTGSNSAGSSTTPSAITITVSNPSPPTVSYTGTTPAGPNYTFTQYTALAATAPNVTPTSSNVKSTGGFAITNTTTNTAGTGTTIPGEPGLAFNVNTGAITGTPTTVSVSQSFTVTVTGTTGLTASTNLTITINVAKPGFTYPTPNVYTAPATVSLSPTNTATGGAVPSGGWSISTTNPLPTGLSFSATNGMITGTATTATAGALAYTITGTNSTGSGTYNITIQVNQAPAFNYMPNTYSIPVGSSLPGTVTPNITGGTPLAIGFGTPVALTAPTPTGEQGMAMDASGNLYVACNSGKVIKYTNATGTPATVPVTFTFPVGIVIDKSSNFYVLDQGTGLVTKYNSSAVAQPFTSPTFTTGYGIAIDANNNIYVADYGASTITEMTSTGTVLLTISTNISTPTAVAVDASGNIYSLNNGTDNVTKYDKNGNYLSIPVTGLLDPYAITIDESGNIYIGQYNTGSGNGSVRVYNNAGGATLTTITGLTDPEGLVISPAGILYVADDTQNSVTRYTPTGGYFVTQNPAALPNILPPGITLNSNTGQFSGTSTLGFPTTAYTVTGYNAAGSGNTPITFTCTTTVPSISYTPASNIYTTNVAITALTPANSGGAAASYSISTPLPAGLLFNTNTGVISGTPTATSPATVYMITATNSAGTSSPFSETITVNPPKPVITYGTPVSFGYNQVVSWSPNNTGGTATGYTVSPALPAGLSINATSGVISGTVNVTTGVAAANYAVTATNGGGSSAPFNVNITIIAQPVIAYTPAVSNLPVNVAVSLTPSNTGGPIAPTSFAAGTGITSATLSNPWGMAIDGSGNIYVANYGNKNVTKYNISAGTTTVITTTANPTSIAVDAAGDIYEGKSNGNLYKFTYPAYGSTTITTVPPSIYGLAIDGSGNVYMADYTGGKIYKYSGSTLSIIIPAGTTGITNPSNVAVDAAGNIYVLDNGSNALNKYNSSGAFQATIVAGLNTPLGLSIDAAGNLYIGDAGTGIVYEYNSSGALLNSITGFNSPRGMVEDGTGNLYVTDYSNGTLTKYPPNNYILTGGTLPTGLSFSNITGTISGTPTQTPYGPTVFTITAHGYAASPASTTETISCYTSYDWIGATGTSGADWNTAANWLSKTIPTSANSAVGTNAQIITKVNIGLNYPVIANPSVAANSYANSITFGNKVTSPVTATSLTVTGSTLAVTTSITKQSDANSAVAHTSTLAGTGTITAASLSVAENATATAAYTDGISSSVTTLTINGNASISTSTSPFAPTLAINVTGGAATVNGNASLTAGSPSVSNLSFNVSGGTATITQNATATATSAFANNLSFNFTGGTSAVTGNALLTSSASTAANNLSFNVNGGITSVTGTLSTANGSGSTSKFAVMPVSPATATLQLLNASALNLGSGNNVVSFANAGATIEYTGTASMQTVYTTAAITGLTTGPSYWNIKFSGTGIKTPNGAATDTLAVAGDFTNLMANTTSNYVSLLNTLVKFNGLQAQSLNGGVGPTIAAGSPTITAPSPTGTVFNNVYFSNKGTNPSTKTIATGGFSVASTGILTMEGTGSYNVLAVNGGSLTLNSTANSSASVAPIATGGPSITGNVNVQRFVTGGSGYRGYRLMSSPVYVLNAPSNAYLINYPINSIFLKGDVAAGVGTGGFDALGNPNLYLYRDDITPSNATFTSGNYRGVNMINNSPAYVYSFDGETSNYDTYPGQGFLCFFRGDRYAAGQTLTTESVTTYVPTNTIITSTGVLNQQAVAAKWWHDPTKSLDFTAAPNNSSTIGFNLVGNPYASTIDLNTASTAAGAGIQLSSISTTTPTVVVGVETNFYELNTNAPYAQQFAIYDVANPALSTNNATRYIASGQGFFAKTDAAGQTLTFNETAKVTTAASQPQSQSTLFMAEEHGRNSMIHRTTGSTDANLKYLRLTLAMDSTSAEDAVVAFKEKSSADFVINEDALYRQGTGKVSLSSMSADNQTLAINMLPLVKKGTTIIPLNVGALADGTYSFNMTEFNNIPATDEVWLKDAKLSDSTSMKIGASYSFAIALADTTTYGSKRFTLVIREDPKKAVHLLNFIANKVINGAKVIWKTDNEQNYTNFVVQRSIDNGKTFDDLNAFVSNAEGSYSFLDTHPIMPADNYRLKITDLSGNISYSNIAPLQYSDLSNKISTNAITVYPNPAVGSINIAISQNFTSASFGVQIVSSSGVVMKKETSGTANWQSDVSRFLPGTYIIQVINNADKTVVGKGTFVKL